MDKLSDQAKAYEAWAAAERERYAGIRKAVRQEIRRRRIEFLRSCARLCLFLIVTLAVVLQFD